MSLSEQDVFEVGGGRGFMSVSVRYLRAVGEVRCVRLCRTSALHTYVGPCSDFWVTENVGGMIGPVRQNPRVQTCPDFLAMADIDGQPPSLGKGLARTSS